VALVFGKAGRAATATDPAPTEMYETIINLKPKEQWRPGVTIAPRSLTVLDTIIDIVRQTGLSKE